MTGRSAVVALAFFGAVAGVNGASAQTDEELLATLEERPTAESGTGVVGRVMTADTDESVIEGQVTVVGRTARALTNLDGYFALDLPPGQYVIRCFYPLYQPTVLEGVVVVEGEVTEVELFVEPDESASEEEFIVEARADTGGEAVQQQVRRQAAVVRDAISSEEIQRSPDSAASDAARRVVAASVVGGQYLYVRGLGGRYTNVLLEGATLPSLDPVVPGVQLDLFPSGVLSNISIIKTYTANLPGVFGGGTMLLETREFPEDFELTLSIGTSLNTVTSFADVPDYEGGSADFLGFDRGGTRSVPGEISGLRLEASEDLPRDQYLEINRRFYDGFAPTTSTALPDLKLGVSLGDTIRFGDEGSGEYLGYLMSFSYSRGTDFYRDEILRRLNADGEPATQDFLRDQVTVSTRLAGLGTVTWGLTQGNDLTFTSLFNQSAEDYREASGGEGRAEVIRRVRQSFVTRTLWFNQLSGDHRDWFGGSRVRWRLNASLASRSQPDTREFDYTQSDGEGPFVWQGRNPSQGQRSFFEFDQLDVGGGASHQSEIGPLNVEFGGAMRYMERDFAARRFQYQRSFTSPTSEREAPIGDLFAGANAGGPWSLREVTNPADSYAANEFLSAAYLTAELPLFDERVRLIAGARVEAFRQSLISDSPFSDVEADADIERTDLDVLPGTNAVVELTDEMAVRVGYSATVARPQIRELSPSTFIDYVRDRQLFGDPNLQRTLIHNLDLRWEYFPGPKEVIAVSSFGKIFEDPIEFVVVSANNVFSYQNVESATNIGFEYEVKLSLGRFWDPLEMFTLGGNFTLVLSEVALTRQQAMRATSAERSLVGQSPFTANASLGFSPDEDLGLEMFLFYNVFGRRIDAAGTNFLADIYEEPVHSLDLVVSWELLDGLALKGALRNLLFQSRRYTQGQVLLREFQPGLTGSVSLSWRH